MNFKKPKIYLSLLGIFLLLVLVFYFFNPLNGENSDKHSIPKEIEIETADGFIFSMVYIPPGKFRMGKDYGLLDYALGSYGSFNTPAFNVVITKGYYIGKDNIHCDFFAAFLNSSDKDIIPLEYINLDNENKYRQFEKNEDKYILLDDENHDICTVSWPGSVAFCGWLSKGTGLAFRLPTEAEWEFAARGPNNKYDQSTWKNFDRRAMAPKDIPNIIAPNGLRGLLRGNWVQDYFDFYTADKKTDPQGPPQPGVTCRNTYDHDVYVLRQPWIEFMGRTDGYDARKNENCFGFRIVLTEDSVRKVIEQQELLPEGVHVRGVVE